MKSLARPSHTLMKHFLSVMAALNVEILPTLPSNLFHNQSLSRSTPVANVVNVTRRPQTYRGINRLTGASTQFPQSVVGNVAKHMCQCQHLPCMFSLTNYSMYVVFAGNSFPDHGFFRDICAPIPERSLMAAHIVEKPLQTDQIYVHICKHTPQIKILSARGAIKLSHLRATSTSTRNRRAYETKIRSTKRMHPFPGPTSHKRRRNQGP